MSSPSVLRRYTPPTCTLEIAAQDSPLSRWVGRPVLKQLKFHLSFDDPRLPEEQRLTLHGDQTQLEDLREAVEAYVQSLLVQSPVRLDTLLSASVEPPARNAATPELPHLSADPNSAMPRDGEPLSSDPQVVPPEPVASASNDPPEYYSVKQEAFPLTPHSANPTGIYLQPNGLLAHHLFLGSLATPESGSVVSLSMLQLFDLATALDEYAAQLVALPMPNRPQKRGFIPFPLQKTPAWARMAAIVLLTVGVTTAAIKLLENRNSESQTAASTANQADTTEEQQIASGSSPTPLPLVTPLPPATSLQPLPTPPLLATPGAPNPNLPPPLGSAASPVPGVLPPASSGLTPTPRPSPPIRANTPSTVGASPQAEYKLPTTARSRSQTQRPNIPATPRTSPAPVQQAPAAVVPRQERQVVAIPNSAAAPVKPDVSLLPRPGQTPQVAASPTSISPANSTPALQTQRSILRSPTPASPARPTPKLQTLPSLPTSPTPATNAEPPVAALRSAPVRTPEANRTPAVEGEGSNSAFDTIPQVTEARKYFQQRWQPPSTLTQDIEYSLVLNPNGSIKNIVPRGQAAETFLDRTEMPLTGEPFVSPIEGGRNATIILVLSKDGKVQTFLAPSTLAPSN